LQKSYSYDSKRNIDLYITGSNAYMLSSELATLLTGRYIAINLHPLSFFEYTLSFPEETNTDRLFRQFFNIIEGIQKKKM